MKNVIVNWNRQVHIDSKYCVRDRLGHVFESHVYQHKNKNCKIRILFLRLKENSLRWLLTVITNEISLNNNYVEHGCSVVNLACVW